MSSSYIKDPDDVLDYKLNWAAWLDGDTITSSSWSLAAGDVVIDSDENTTEQTVAWVSGGTEGTTGQITNHIVTAAGREKDWSIIFKIIDQ